MYVTVAGKFPDTGKTWTYNEVDYSIDTSNAVDSKVIKADNIWSKKSASDKLISIYPNRKGSVKSDAYTYAVPKDINLESVKDLTLVVVVRKVVTCTLSPGLILQ